MAAATGEAVGAHAASSDRPCRTRSELLLVRREENLALGTAYEQSQAAAQTAQERYDLGLGNLIELLETLRRAITAEGRWWSARRRQLENRVNLHLALGGGFETLKKDGTARQ